MQLVDQSGMDDRIWGPEWCGEQKVGSGLEIRDDIVVW